MEREFIGDEDTVNDGSPEPKIFRVLSLDGGGAKGFYTLGALKEIEALSPLREVRPHLRPAPSSPRCSALGSLSTRSKRSIASMS